jgi:anti-sigma factor RsiW
MTLTEELAGRLLAYADGQLEEAQLAETEALLKHDPEAAAFVGLLKAGQVPYAEAFAHELTEPLPDSIIDCVRTFRTRGVRK